MRSFLKKAWDPKIQKNLNDRDSHRSDNITPEERYRLELHAVYSTWKAGGKTPYEYLFLLPRDHLEVDFATLLVGSEVETEILGKDNKEMSGLDKMS